MSTATCTAKDADTPTFQPLQLHEREPLQRPTGHLSQIRILSLSGTQLPRTTSLPPRVCALRKIELDKYSGQTSWTDWLARFEDYISVTYPAATPDLKARLLRFFVAGPAEALLDTLDRGTTYDEATNFLATKFTTNAQSHSARAQLRFCKQERTESVLSFLDRLTRILRESLGATPRQTFEVRLAQEFVDRVRPDISFQLTAQGIETLEEAVQTARILENVLPKQTDTAELIRIAQGVQRDEQPRQQIQSEARPPRQFQPQYQRYQPCPVECYYCHRLGHIRRNCHRRMEDEDRQFNSRHQEEYIDDFDFEPRANDVQDQYEENWNPQQEFDYNGSYPPQARSFNRINVVAASASTRTDTENATTHAATRIEQPEEHDQLLSTLVHDEQSGFANSH